MKKHITGAALALTVLYAAASPCQAELWPQTGTAYINGIAQPDVQVIYDDCLDISYLDIDSGKLDWGDAHDFIISLSWVAADGTVYTDWRLPSLRETTVIAADVTESELGHLFYEELGNISIVNDEACEADEEEEESECVPAGLVAILPLQTLTAENPYWYGDDALATYETYAPYFDFATGLQGEIAKISPLYVLPVRDGAVAEPVLQPIVRLPRKPSSFGHRKNMGEEPGRVTSCPFGCR
ncbi:MAG: hypothetical protein ACOY4H_04975 [Thermodesulfobacteriota bacterium]